MRKAGLPSEPALTLRHAILVPPIGGLILPCDPTDALRAADWSSCDARLRQALRRRLGSRGGSGGGSAGWSLVARDGALTGNADGLARKRWLLSQMADAPDG